MPFIFLIESASSAVDLLFTAAEVSPSCLDGRSWRAGSTEVAEPGVTPPTSSDRDREEGEVPTVPLGSPCVPRHRSTKHKAR